MSILTDRIEEEGVSLTAFATPSPSEVVWATTTITIAGVEVVVYAADVLPGELAARYFPPQWTSEGPERGWVTLCDHTTPNSAAVDPAAFPEWAEFVEWAAATSAAVIDALETLQLGVPAHSVRWPALEVTPAQVLTQTPEETAAAWSAVAALRIEAVNPDVLARAYVAAADREAALRTQVHEAEDALRILETSGRTTPAALEDARREFAKMQAVLGVAQAETAEAAAALARRVPGDQVRRIVAQHRRG